MLSHLHITGSKVLVALAIFIGGTVLWYVVQFTRHELRIRKIGGVRAPRMASNPFGAVLWFSGTAQAQMQHRLLAFFETFLDKADPLTGDCVEIQILPNQRYLITRDPEQMKAILTTKFTSFGKGKVFHDLWRPFLGDSIFTTDGSMWHDSRSLIRPMFIKDRVSDLATFERWTQGLISKIPRDTAGGNRAIPFDIMDLFYRMTLDVTTDFLLGASVNSLENPRSEFAEAFNDVQRIYMMLTMLGPFQALVPRRQVNKGIDTLNKFVMPYIEQALALPPEELEKLSSSDKSFTFLHSVVRHTRDPRVLRDQIVAVLLAGRDTTAATLSWLFYELSHYPEKFKKLRDEVIEKVGRTRTPTYDDLKDMVYMKHALNETLRLYPAVPFNLRTALEDTTLPGAPGHPGVSVVEGDTVAYSTMSMQRRPELYPPVSDKFADPGVFSPERWDDWTPKHWQFIPFNGGPRICVGQNFAMTEMSYVVVRLLQKYDRLEYSGDWHAQWHEAEVVGRPGQGVKVLLHEETVTIASERSAPLPLT